MLKYRAYFLLTKLFSLLKNAFSSDESHNQKRNERIRRHISRPGTSSNDENVHFLSRSIHRKNLRIQEVVWEDRGCPPCEEMPIQFGVRSGRIVDVVRASGQTIGASGARRGCKTLTLLKFA